MKKCIGLALALTIIACGKAQDDETPPLDPVEENTAQTVAVRVLGVRASGPVRVQVAALELTVDGNALPSRIGGSEIDLGNDQNAWAVTTFDLPVDARKVGLRLKFQSEGIVERNGKSQLLDLSGPPVHSSRTPRRSGSAARSCSRSTSRARWSTAANRSSCFRSSSFATDKTSSITTTCCEFELKRQRKADGGKYAFGMVVGNSGPAHGQCRACARIGMRQASEW